MPLLFCLAARSRAAIFLGQPSRVFAHCFTNDNNATLQASFTWNPNERKHMKLIKHLTVGLAVVALLAGALNITASNEVGSQKGPASRAPVFDVSYDGATARTLYGQTGTISRGDAFIITGKIYRGGTIPAEGVFSPFTPGSIGTWTCRGVYNFDLADLNLGKEPMVFTTQTFQFDDGTMIVTEGPEGLATHIRAVTGGTGKAKGATGQVRQEFLGANETVDVDSMPGLNFRFTFDLKHPLTK